MALPDTSENQILERIVRIEESLAHHIELTRQGFSEMNRRFELLLDQTNKRFEQVEKRFEQVEKRFEQIDKRFEQIDKRFEAMQIQIDRRFEQVDRRFEQIDKRFDQVDRRFDALTRRMDRFMVWSFSTTLAVGSIVIGVLKVWL
jgi:predicted RNase H-like nuclease (RuvC/YqgF family)